MIRTIPILPTIVVAAAVATMIALGIWQLGRAEEKEALIARYEGNKTAGLITEIDIWSAQQDLYRSVELACPDPKRWQAVAGRNLSGQNGFSHQFVCQKSVFEALGPEGTVTTFVFGAIGWSRSPSKPEWDGGTIIGVLSPAGKHYRVTAFEGLAGLEPLAKPDPNDLPNNHLAYAGQWFFFALTALVIYVLALRRRRRSE